MPRLDHKDVQLVWHREGVDSIEEIIDAGLVSAHTMRRAFSELQGEPGIDVLRDLLDGTGMLSKGGIGAPDAGDSRSYKTQEMDGRQVIVLPVGHLDVETGEPVRADFNVDDIRVRRNN